MLETEATFGAWLRHQRRQLDLTQTELAARVGYSVVTIRKLERDELRPSKQLAERLAQQLNVAVAHRASTVALARMPATQPPLAAARPVQPHAPSNLVPPLTPFFGRATELLELAQLLTDPDCRLLTVVGPGGIGKTRLVIEVAQTLVQQAPHGICFVALAPLRASEHIVPAIAEALDFRFQANNRLPKAQLLDYLRHKQLLLVLDNFEHLSDGIALLPELLQNCPGLRLLVTSRERLQLSSETVFVLNSLDVPSGPLPHAALGYSAVQLFVETARRTRPTFVLDATNEQAVIHICRLVGGIPLAIILAAAWVKLLSPAEIVTELGQGFDLLETEFRDLPARHHSMRVVLAQSWQRLSALEQAVFRRLAVFRGGFTRPAAQSVAGASLRMLSRLVNKSLIQRDAHGRYTLHELLRQYAEAELDATDQTAATRTAHYRYYTEYLHQHEADLKGRRQVAALDEIEADFENVRAAWQWAIAQRDYPAIDRALEALYWFCEMRSRFHEGLELLRSAREQLAPLAGEAPQPAWGRVMARALGQDFRWFEPPTESRARIETGLALAQAHDDQPEIAFCLWRLGMALIFCEDAPGAIAYFEQSIVHYQALADRFYLAILQRNVGILYIELGQSNKSALLIMQSIALCRDTSDLNGLAQSLALAGWIVYIDGHYTKAEAHWQEARELCLKIDARYTLVPIQLGFAWLALFDRGDFGAVRTLAEELRTIVLDINDSQSQHRTMLIVFAFLAGMSEDYRACHHCFQQAIALNLPYFPYTAALELMGLCLAACGMDDLPSARQHLQKVLEISLIHHWPSNFAKGLTLAAIITAKSGQPERATELLGLVFHHPLSPKGWLAQWPLITRLRTELAATLPPEHYVGAWTRGTQLDLMATAAVVVAELETRDRSDSHASIDIIPV